MAATIAARVDARRTRTGAAFSWISSSSVLTSFFWTSVRPRLAVSVSNRFVVAAPPPPKPPGPLAGVGAANAPTNKRTRSGRTSEDRMIWPITGHLLVHHHRPHHPGRHRVPQNRHGPARQKRERPPRGGRTPWAPSS